MKNLQSIINEYRAGQITWGMLLSKAFYLLDAGEIDINIFEYVILRNDYY